MRGLLVLILLALLLLPVAVAIAQSGDYVLYLKPDQMSMSVDEEKQVLLVLVPRNPDFVALEALITVKVRGYARLLAVYTDYGSASAFNETHGYAQIVLKLEPEQEYTLLRIVVYGEKPGIDVLEVEGAYVFYDSRGDQHAYVATRTCAIEVREARLSHTIAPYAGIGGLAAILASLFTPIPQEYKTPLMILGVLLLLLAFAGFMGLLPF